MGKYNFSTVLLGGLLVFGVGGCGAPARQDVANSGSNSNSEASPKAAADKPTNKPASPLSEDFRESQLAKATAKRESPVGLSAAGLIVPEEFKSNNVVRRKAALAELVKSGYLQPLDFDDLAAKYQKGELTALPVASASLVVEIDPDVDDKPFSSFDFEGGSKPLAQDSTEYAVLKTLSENFDGDKYDLTNAGDRKQFRKHLLRMLQPAAVKVLNEIAADYQKKFNRPLLINAATRSMDNQFDLNKRSANSFKVRGTGSLAPHTSGLAFDISRVYLTAEEQNFLTAKLSEMKRAGLIEALIENGDRPVLHVFAYANGKPPTI